MDNLFAKPSIQAVRNSTASVQQTLDDYDPFSNDSSQQRTGAGQQNIGGFRQTATLQPSSQTVPTYSHQSGAQYNSNAAVHGASRFTAMTQISTAKLQWHQDELERRKAELMNSINVSRPNN